MVGDDRSAARRQSLSPAKFCSHKWAVSVILAPAILRLDTALGPGLRLYRVLSALDPSSRLRELERKLAPRIALCLAAPTSCQSVTTATLSAARSCADTPSGPSTSHAVWIITDDLDDSDPSTTVLWPSDY